MNLPRTINCLLGLILLAALGCQTISREQAILERDWKEWRAASSQASIRPKKFDSVSLTEVLHYAEKEMNRSSFSGIWTFGLYQVKDDMRSISEKEAEENHRYSAEFQAEFPMDTFLETVEVLTRTSYRIEGRKILFGKAF